MNSLSFCRRLAMVAALGCAACSSSSPGGSTGSSTSGSSGSSGTTGSGVSAVLDGGLAFGVTAQEAAAPVLGDGGFDFRSVFVTLSDAPSACSQAGDHVLTIIGLRSTSIGAGTYDLTPLAQLENYAADGGGADRDAGIFEVVYGEANGGIRVYLDTSASGTVTFDHLDAQKISGSFSAVMAPSDGGAQTSLTGTFDSVCVNHEIP